MINSMNTYYIFYIAAQCGSLSAAAGKLYISQPAVSKAIARLEESFHCPLLVRSFRGVKLTEAGEILYQQLNTAFHAIQAGEEQLQKNELLEAGKLSIGVSTTLCKYVLLPYLQQYLRDNPHVKVSILCQSTYETIAALEKGSLDIGLVGETQQTGQLEFLPVKEIHDIFVGAGSYIRCLELQTASKAEADKPESDNARAASPEAAGKAPASANAVQSGAVPGESALFANATLLLLDKNNVTRQYVDKYMLLQNLSGGQLIEVTTMDLLIDFAKIGLGLACVIREFVEKELQNGSLVQLPTREPVPSRRIGFAYAKNIPQTRAVRSFLKFLTPSQEDPEAPGPAG